MNRHDIFMLNSVHWSTYLIWLGWLVVAKRLLISLTIYSQDDIEYDIRLIIGTILIIIWESNAIMKLEFKDFFIDVLIFQTIFTWIFVFAFVTLSLINEFQSMLHFWKVSLHTLVLLSLKSNIVCNKNVVLNIKR